jgi:hypothetical protein
MFCVIIINTSSSSRFRPIGLFRPPGYAHWSIHLIGGRPVSLLPLGWQLNIFRGYKLSYERSVRNFHLPVPVGSSPAKSMDVCPVFCVVLSRIRTGLCDGSISRPKSSTKRLNTLRNLPCVRWPRSFQGTAKPRRMEGKEVVSFRVHQLQVF